MSREGDLVTVFQDDAGEWRWHRKAVNGEIISDSSEGYVDRDHAMHMARELNSDVAIQLKDPRFTEGGGE